MTLTYGNIRIGTRHLYLILVLLLLFTDMLFFEMLVGKRGSGGVQGKGPEKQLLVVAVLFSILFFKQMSPFLKKWALVGFAYMFFLVLESYYIYHRPIAYPHVFSKVTVVFILLYLYPFFLEARASQLKWIVYLLVFSFFLHLFWLKPEILRISSFIIGDRNINASSVYLLLLPCLYFFNRYLEGKGWFHLLAFFGLVFLLIFLQHRTVWIAMAASLAFNVFLVMTRSRTKLRLRLLMPMVVLPVVFLFLVSSLVIAKNPEFLERLTQRYDDIVNVEEQGTGSWRLEQFRSYTPYIEQHLLGGMRYSGFDLPIQFYDRDQLIWADGTGHHFHSFYVDKLFYFGLIGLLYILVPMGYLIYKIFKKSHLSANQMAIATYAVSGIAYGMSYDWPVWFYGIVGIALSFIDREGEDVSEMEAVEGAEEAPNPPPVVFSERSKVL